MSFVMSEWTARELCTSIKNKSLSKEGAMKRIIMAMVLVMMLVSIGGCLWWDPYYRDGRGGGQHDRDGGHDRRR
jgi:hypothetical protein